MGRTLDRALVIVCVVSLLAALGAAVVQAQQAARIDAVAPSQAAPGQVVTITGIGFGGRNVEITVGGVPARVISATGSQVTFAVPTASPPGRPRSPRRIPADIQDEFGSSFPDRRTHRPPSTRDRIRRSRLPDTRDAERHRHRRWAAAGIGADDSVEQGQRSRHRHIQRGERRDDDGVVLRGGIVRPAPGRERLRVQRQRRRDDRGSCREPRPDRGCRRRLQPARDQDGPTRRKRVASIRTTIR